MPESVGLERLVSDLRDIGIPRGGNILVHSSLKSIGYVEGGAPTVVEALVSAAGPDGTVVVPTLSGNRDLGPENPPVFDPDETPCWTGAIPETFRKDPRARRSLHPTHSVAAIGPSSAALLYAHEVSQTPCGPETPYLRLARPEFEGRILFIGCGLEVSTTFHGIEELVGVPYHLQRRWCEARILTRTGEGKNVKADERRVVIRLHSYEGPRRDYPAVEGVLEKKEALARGRLGKAQCLLVRTPGTVAIVSEMLRKDPELLLAEEEKGQGWGTGERLPGE